MTTWKTRLSSKSTSNSKITLIHLKSTKSLENKYMKSSSYPKVPSGSYGWLKTKKQNNNSLSKESFAWLRTDWESPRSKRTSWVFSRNRRTLCSTSVEIFSVEMVKKLSSPSCNYAKGEHCLIFFKKDKIKALHNNNSLR